MSDVYVYIGSPYVPFFHSCYFICIAGIERSREREEERERGSERERETERGREGERESERDSERGKEREREREREREGGGLHLTEVPTVCHEGSGAGPRQVLL